MEVRLIARGDTDQHAVTGKITRATSTLIQVRTPDHLHHWCFRHNGAPKGRSAYLVHPDDVARLQGPEVEALKQGAPKRKVSPYPRQWDL